MNYKLVIPFLFLMCSCTQNVTDINRAQILGEWYPLDIENLEGYHFMENNLCENKLGYYDRYSFSNKKSDWPGQYVSTYKEDSSRQIHFDEWCIINYQGNTTFYKVDKDSLRIYDLTKKKLVNWEIKFLSKDTMLLSSNNDSIVNKFVRRDYQTDTIPLFDEIVFSLKSSTPVNIGDDRYISINRDGEVITFLPEGYNLVKMNEKAFEDIENRFKKADIKTIIANYKRENKQESEFVKSSITFVKGDKIVLSLENPIETINTKEFLWAYLSALFCLSYNQLDLYNNRDFYSWSNHFPEIFFVETAFYARDHIWELYGSERFYLRGLIKKAGLTNTTFIPKYILRNPSIYDATRKFETDGRFFRYKEKDGERFTLDLGFNFIEENNLADKFRKNK